MAETADDWGLLVNECGIFASTIAEGRWLHFLAVAKDERLTMLWTGPGGGEWHVMCGAKEAAAEAREIFLDVGFHAGHVKVARLSACQANTEKRRAEIDARIAAIASGVPCG